jgi:hypothetical protein
MNSNDDKLIYKIQMDGTICDHFLFLFFCNEKKSNKHIRLFYSYSTKINKKHLTRSEFHLNIEISHD